MLDSSCCFCLLFDERFLGEFLFEKFLQTLNLSLGFLRIIKLVIHTHTDVFARPDLIPEFGVLIAVSAPSTINTTNVFLCCTKLFKSNVRLHERHCCVVTFPKSVRACSLNVIMPSFSDEFQNLSFLQTTTVRVVSQQMHTSDRNKRQFS